MKKFILLCSGIALCATLTACGNKNENSTTNSAKSSSITKKADNNSSKKITNNSVKSSRTSKKGLKNSSQSERINSSRANTSSYSSTNNSSAPEINNAQDALNYLKQQKGDGNYTIAHGTFGMSDHPYASIVDQDNNTTYYVYKDGQIEISND